MIFSKNLSGIKNLSSAKAFVYFVCIGLFLPLLSLFYYSINTNSFDFPIGTFNYFKNTFVLIFLTSAITIIMGVLPAWLITRFDIKYKSILDLLLVIPLAIPGYIMSYTYADILGYNGLLDIFFQKNFNVSLKFDVLTIEWLSLFLAFSLYPYVYTTSRIAFNLISNTYIDLISSLGISNIKSFIKIILPLSASAIISGTFLVAMEILNDYGAVKYFGINTFSVGIFKYWFSMDQKDSAIIFSLFLILLVIAILLITNFVKRNNLKKNLYIKSSSFGSKKIDNKMSNFFIHFILLVPVFFAFLVPLLFIIKNIFIYYSFYNYQEILIALRNSLLLAFISAISITILTFIILCIERYVKNSKLNILTDLLASGYAIPGAVIGLSIMLIVNFFGESINFLIGTIFLLIYSYIFRFIAVAIYPLKSNLQRLPERFDELAKSLGFNYLKIFFKINLPLSKIALISSFLIVFIDVFKELPLTLILRPFNFETLATQAYQYADDEMLAYSSVYSLLIIFICSIMIILTKLIFKIK